MSGYIRLHRKIHSNALLGKNPMARFVFLELLIEASWKDRVVDDRGRPLTLKRGQVRCSIREISEKTGLSQRNIRTIISAMTMHNIVEIDTRAGKQASIITICNYSKYQDDVNTDDTYTDKQATNKRQTYKEGEEGKEGKEVSVSEELTLVETVEPVPVSKVPIKEAVDLWNETASRCGLPQVQRLTAQRKAKLRTRLKTYSIDDWRLALAGIEKSEFLCGEVEGKTWRADFDWLVRNDEQIDKILSGKYGNGRGSHDDFMMGMSPKEYQQHLLQRG